MSYQTHRLFLSLIKISVEQFSANYRFTYLILSFIKNFVLPFITSSVSPINLSTTNYLLTRLSKKHF